MNWTQITKPEYPVSLQIRAQGCISITYDSGRVWTINNVMWSTSSNDSTAAEPTAGRLNLFQNGAASGLGLPGIEVSTAHPITLDSIVYTDINVLTTKLVADFALL